MGTSSNDAFDEDERPTKKREALDPVDVANAMNKTQTLSPRKILGEMFDGPREMTSGTRPAITAEAIQRFEAERHERQAAAEPDGLSKFERPTVEMQAFEAIDPACEIAVAPSLDLFCEPPRGALFFTRHEGRLVLTPAFLALAVTLALVAGGLIAYALQR